jgi:restriction system protein
MEWAVAIPDYQSLMLPVLQLAADGQEHTLREATERMGTQLSLTEDERRVLLPSGRQAVFDNRIGWARTYLVKAGVLASSGRGRFRVTPSGMALLQSQPTAITVKTLEQFESFRAFRDHGHAAGDGLTIDGEEETPEERLEKSFLSLQDALAKELQAVVAGCSPKFFERLVIDLLLTMGYGGSRREAGEAVGQSGDGGIDGIIKEDVLGLDSIYIQAKRWDGPVGRPVVQAFVGSLEGRRARKGVLITTSAFSPQAHEYVQHIEKRVVLIDGAQLVRLMVEHNIGVQPTSTFVIKRVDRDYFESDGMAE